MRMHIDRLDVLAFTVTGNRWPLGCCARAPSSIPQLQNATPAVPAAIFSKCLLVVISPPRLHSAFDPSNAASKN
jgi:hypothetical protein